MAIPPRRPPATPLALLKVEREHDRGLDRVLDRVDPTSRSAACLCGHTTTPTEPAAPGLDSTRGKIWTPRWPSWSMRTDHPLTLTVEEAGDVLGVGRSTAYELVRSGDLSCLRLRRRIVVPVAHVAERLGVTPAEVWAALRPSARTPAAARHAATVPTMNSEPGRLF